MNFKTSFKLFSALHDKGNHSPGTTLTVPVVSRKVALEINKRQKTCSNFLFLL